MLRKFKITYVETKTTRTPKQFTMELEAYSKYNAKKKFYAMYPSSIITSIEEVKE